jgi:tRNA A37 threonylcarbamoyladenosine modification protein TsaB
VILFIRTDKPTAELYVYSENKQLDEFFWQGDRQLADTLLVNIQELLSRNNAKLNGIKGIVVFTGKGSFTGLRIGSTVANTLAYSYQILVVSGEGKDWQADGLKKLTSAKLGQYVVPKYHSEPNITKPKN